MSPRTRTLAGNGASAQPDFRRSNPRDPVLQPVRKVESDEPASSGQALEDAPSSEADFRRSDPPPAVKQPVRVADDGKALALAEPDTAANLPLSLKEADYADEIGDEPDPEWPSAEPAPAGVLDNRAIYRIVREVAVADSGDALYSATAADPEYATAGQPAYQRRHFGLGFGLVLFTQVSGHLGTVLGLMKQRDSTAFADVFGPQADALLATTSAATAAERLQPVGSEPLWGPGWVERFRRAGAVPAFQAAQNEQAIEGMFRPMLNVAFGLGLMTDRGLAMAFDRVVVRGLGGGLRWLVQAAGVLRSGAQREQALALLDIDDVAHFQMVMGWTPRDGRFGPETHAALMGALRRQGATPLPTPDQQVWQLAALATGRARSRLVRLRDSTAFTDVVYAPG
jgi:hypothetical protein